MWVDTDLAVPDFASSLRVDVYSMQGEWYDSREVFLGGASDWPASFSLVNDANTDDVEALVRLRAFPEGAIREYRGELFDEVSPFAPARSASTVAELCADPPLLELGSTVTGRRGRDPIFEHPFSGSNECFMVNNTRGSIAARVEIETAGRYSFAVIRTSAASTGDSQQTRPQVTLELRSACATQSSAVACTLGYDLTANLPVEPRLDVDLQPGTYFLVTGGGANLDDVADVTLAAWSKEVPELSRVPPPATTEPPPFTPLLGGDASRTPTTEPVPARTVDRLVRMRIPSGKRASATVELAGDCLGRQARLGEEPGAADPERTMSCIDAEEPWQSSETLELAPFLRVPTSSHVGRFASNEGCAADESNDRFVCVPGGLFVFGNDDLVTSDGSSRPERPAKISRFWIDRYEATVADYRAAEGQGLVLDEDDLPYDNPKTLPTKPSQLTDFTDQCTFKSNNHDPEREALPMTCIDWHAARAYCSFAGGDLPSIAQWQYAMLAAGRKQKALFPWGDETPSCECDDDPACHRLVASRSQVATGVSETQFSECLSTGFGPEASDSLGGPNGDENPLGIVGGGGNVSEWTLDANEPLGGSCWRSQPLVDPVCFEDEAPARMIGGRSYRDELRLTIQLTSFYGPGWTVPSLGMRCAYADRPF